MPARRHSLADCFQVKRHGLGICKRQHEAHRHIALRAHGMEEPGHPHARNSFSVRAPRIINIPVDQEGLVTDTMPPLDYVYVTPSHQSPTCEP